MRENESRSIPLVYRSKILAALQLVCGLGMFVAVAAQGGFMIELVKQGDVGTWHVLSVISGAFGCVVFGVGAPESWRVFRGGASIWIENDNLVIRFAGTRRIPLDQITQVESDRFASGHDPASLTLHLRNAKPMTLWLVTLRPVSGIVDTLRRAIAKPA